MEEGFAAGEVDLLDAKRLRLLDRASNAASVHRREPRVRGPRGVDTVGAPEVAPGSGDLDPERRQTKEGGRGRGGGLDVGGERRLARRRAHELGAQSQPATDQVVERNNSCSPSQQEEQDRAPDKVLVPGLRVDEQLDGHDLPEEG